MFSNAITRQNFSRAGFALALIVCAGALIVLPLTSALVLIGGALALIALLRWHELALYALVLAIPYGSWFPLATFAGNVTIADALIALALGLWLTRMIVSERAVRVRLPPLAAPFALFLGVAFLSFTVAASFQAALKEFAKWAEMFAVYVLVANTLDETKLNRLLGVIFFAGLSEAAIGIYQFVFKVGPKGFILFEQFIRAYGTFEQPNPYAGYLGLIIPVAFGVALGVWQSKTTDDGRPASERPTHHATRITASLSSILARVSLGALASISLAAMLAALAMSWSRGAWLGVAAALVAAFIVQSRRAFFFANVGALLLASAVILGSLNLIPDFVAERFSGIANYFGIFDVRGVPVNDANFAVIERMAHWQAAAEMFSEQPWLGIGIGNYAVAYPRYALPHWDDPLGHAHNYLLNVAAETGLVGAVSYVLLWGAAFWQGLRAVRASRGIYRALAAGLVGMLVALTVQNAFDNLFVHGMHMQVGIGLGIVAYLNWVRDAHA